MTFPGATNVQSASVNDGTQLGGTTIDQNGGASQPIGPVDPDAAAPPPSADDIDGADDTDLRAEQATRDKLRVQYSWMPPGALDLFIDSYIEHGADFAWGYVRADPRYEQWFPGNMDDDGNIRYEERNYAGIREGYRDIFRSVGLEPGAIPGFEAKITELMEGEVSVQELDWRVESTYNRIVSASDSIKEYYAREHDIQGLETADLMLAALDPDMGDLVLGQSFRVAEVGGTALGYGYDLDSERVLELVEEGVDLNKARQTFADASNLIPILDTLAKRHNDPDDDFDINEFLASDVFNDRSMNLRMRRLQARERATFGKTGRFAQQGERIVGLTAS